MFVWSERQREAHLIDWRRDNFSNYPSLSLFRPKCWWHSGCSAPKFDRIPEKQDQTPGLCQAQPGFSSWFSEPKSKCFCHFKTILLIYLHLTIRWREKQQMIKVHFLLCLKVDLNENSQPRYASKLWKLNAREVLDEKNLPVAKRFVFKSRCSVAECSASVHQPLWLDLGLKRMPLLYNLNLPWCKYSPHQD